MKRSVQKGFTLIELMIVVAIVGILAAIAIPAYKDFTVRARVSEVLAAMGACKTKLEDYYQANSNSWANSAGTDVAAISPGLCDTNATAANQTKYLAGMTLSAGGPQPVITATTSAAMGDPGANSLVINMSPRGQNNGALTPPANIGSWVCGDTGTTVQARFRPGSCQG